ncbi:TetR family transcriptional regulator [Novosphingobium sp. ST904]|nr:TetR family transcriptional regulator [Novosphingobium sp. ST904]
MPENPRKPSNDRLLEAVFEQWSAVGGSGVTARQVAGIADIPVSSIYHHFGSLEQLLVVAQDHARQQARLWCDEQLGQVSGFAGDYRDFPAFFAQIVDGWANERRGLAFAWREGQLLAATSPAFLQAEGEWRDLWAGFWQVAAAKFGLADRAVVAERVFENESFLHMFRWRRTVDRAGLDEFARGLAAWLSGRPIPEAPWRDYARAEALRELPAFPERDATGARIVEAAAALLEKTGASGLTHRAVAESAGLTLGVVSHKFRTKSELVQAAFEGTYLSGVTRFRSDALPGSDTAAEAAIEQALDNMVGFIAHSVRGRGMDELHIAVARDPALNQFAAQLRYLRGQTSRKLLEALIQGRRQAGNLEAALLSSFLSSLTRNHAGAEGETSRAAIRREFEAVVDLIRAG